MIRCLPYRPLRHLMLTATIAACSALFAQERLSANELDRFSLLHPAAPIDLGKGRIVQSARSLPPLPSTWTYNDLGFFCKLDVQLERHLPIPVFFRVGGDVRQIDLWEGKHDPSY